SLGATSLRSAPVTIHVPYDNDNDALPDWWEIKYFGNLGAAAAADTDGDSLTNLQEYQAGSDPNDYYNGQTPVIEIVSGNHQFVQPGTAASQLLVVRVKKSNGTLLPYAPVSFRVTQGGSLVETGQ